MKIYKEKDHDAFISGRICTKILVLEERAIGKYFELDDIPGYPGVSQTVGDAWLEAQTLAGHDFIAVGARADGPPPGFEPIKSGPGHDGHYSHRYWAYKKLRNDPRWGVWSEQQFDEHIDGLAGLPEIKAFIKSFVRAFILLRDFAGEHPEGDL